MCTGLRTYQYLLVFKKGIERKEKPGDSVLLVGWISRKNEQKIEKQVVMEKHKNCNVLKLVMKR